jgi:hypothetical protein
MEWMLRLVGTGLDGQSRSFDVMEISRPDDLGDIADLGMTLSEAKQLLGQVQRQIVAAQTSNQAMFRPHCRSTPELDQLQARLSALMPYRVAADLLLHLLPIDAAKSPETLRSHTLQIGSSLVMWRQRSRQPPQQSLSRWTRPSYAAAKTVNVTWRFVSATSKQRPVAARFLLP